MKILTYNEQMQANLGKIEASWKAALADELSTQYFRNLIAFVETECQKGTIYPAPENIFAAFAACPFESVNVVILGQDPYHGEGQANGLCFAVPEGVDIPPSLRNIFKEIESDLGIKPMQSGDLTRWAKQGVLLLNATLTVRANAAGSHQKKGWEEFTDAAIRALSEKREGLVFLLWGNYARKKGAHIDRSKHLVLESAHPSPLSAYAGFFGNKHFGKTNEYLKKQNKSEIDWR
jgi:uracil-DNA glycosylase